MSTNDDDEDMHTTEMTGQDVSYAADDGDDDGDDDH